MRDDLDKLAYKLYTTHLVNTHLLAKEVNGICTCLKALKEWEKFRGDWRQIAKRYSQGKL